MSSTMARRGQAGPGNGLEMVLSHQLHTVPPSPQGSGGWHPLQPPLHQLGPGHFPLYQRGISGILG